MQQSKISDIYYTLKEWLQSVDSKDRSTRLRDQFGSLEKKVFGKQPTQRVQNQLAMQYDSVRNKLVMHIGKEMYSNYNPSFLEDARKLFYRIPQPDKQ
ncbi:MAG: hypothetical protein ABIA37_05100 [Candidatus Woesearchaeota archaeon]